jgi:hypothetical protein
MTRTHRYQHLRQRKDKTPVITETVSAGPKKAAKKTTKKKTTKATAPTVRRTNVDDAKDSKE